MITKKQLMKAITIKNNTITIKGIDLSKMSVHIEEHIGGDMYTQNIGGYNSNWDIGGNNQQFHIKGENSQFNIGGDNNQHNIGGYNRQWNIGGYSFQWNVKKGSRNSNHWVDKEKGIKSVDTDYTEGVLLHSVKSRKLGRGVEYIEGKSGKEKVYLVKTPSLAYHSNISLEDAKRGFKEKRDRLFNKLGEWVKTLTDDTIITREIFHKETGACIPGINAWCNKVGISKKTKKITFKEFKELAEKNPTRETEQVMLVLKELESE